MHRMLRLLLLRIDQAIHRKGSFERLYSTAARLGCLWHRVEVEADLVTGTSRPRSRPPTR